jgi:hypothetical protein
MNRKRSILILALAAGLVLALAAPATATHRRHAEITRGQVVTLDGGHDLGYSLRGRAVMVRFADATFVAVRVKGLDANTTYPVHVHNAPCSATPPGGGHYQNEVGGAADDVNEIWPAVTTNAHGRGWGTAWHGFHARPEAMAIVIHYPPDTSIRLACIDLS